MRVEGLTPDIVCLVTKVAHHHFFISICIISWGAYAGTFVYFAPGAVFVASTLLPHLILVLGATISLVSFLGYYGAMNEKRWVLWTHGLILLIAIALQITVGAIAFVYRNQGNEVLDQAWDRVYRSDPRVIRDLESFVSQWAAQRSCQCRCLTTKEHKSKTH